MLEVYIRKKLKKRRQLVTRVMRRWESNQITFSSWSVYFPPLPLCSHRKSLTGKRERGWEGERDTESTWGMLTFTCDQKRLPSCDLSVWWLASLLPEFFPLPVSVWDFPPLSLLAFIPFLSIWCPQKLDKNGSLNYWLLINWITNQLSN